MQTIKLGDIAEFQEGYVNPKQTNNSYFDGPIKWLRAVDLNNSTVYSTSRTLTKRGFESAGKSAYLFPPNSLAISKSGTIGRVGILKDWMCGNRAVINIKPNESITNKKYLFYCLLLGRPQIERLAEGSVQKNLYISELSKFEIPLPILEIQNKIAHILGTLDAKIELNKKTNETFEGIAKALFKSWFVDFDPVRAKAEGRSTGLPEEISNLFPNSFENSELGEIPSGWKIGNIDQIALNPKETAKPFQMDSSDRYIGLEHMPRESIALSDSGTAENLASNKNVFKKGDILYGKLRPYFKKTGFAQFDGVCSTDIIVVREKFKLCKGFICFLLASNPFIDFTVALSSGTRMPRTSWNQMCEFLLPFPPLPLVQIFGEIVSPILDKIKINSEQSISLSSVRDALLPKLISGELRIPDAEKMIEESQK